LAFEEKLHNIFRITDESRKSENVVRGLPQTDWFGGTVKVMSGHYCRESATAIDVEHRSYHAGDRARNPWLKISQDWIL
jgi:hypothetical protein